MELTQSQIDELTRALDARRAALLSARDDASPLLITEGDSRSPEELEQDVPGAEAELAIEDAHSMELRDIEAARARMLQGVYGRCLDCGADIPFARLRAYPTAKRCVSCQDVHEQRRGGTLGGPRGHVGA